MRASPTILALVFLIALPACSGSDVAQCRVGADCASGACGLDGRCVPVTTGGDAKADSDASADGVTDATSDDVDARDATTDATGCVSNGDGIITASEVPLAAGLKATFRVATDASVSTAGTTSGGKRNWDLSSALSGDKDVLIETLPPAGKWWASQFAGATYATTLSATTDLLGVFRVADASLTLLGVVSPSDGPSRTLLTYASPVPVLVFPLNSTSKFGVTSAVTGQASGVFGTYNEAYDSAVDAQGTMKTPFGSFGVLRVRTILKRTVGLIVTTTRTFTFVAECFGPVAIVVSKANETAEEFTSAAEVRRLAP